MDICERLRAYSREYEIDGLYIQAECMDTAAAEIEYLRRQIQKQRDVALAAADRLDVVLEKLSKVLDHE